jgi:hypothetical protein
MSVQVAFYIGNTTIADKLICMRTQSDTSHVEIVIDGMKYSSYPGIGVRKDVFVNDPNLWRVYDLPEVNAQDVLSFYDNTKGRAYDWIGVLIGQFFYVKIDDPSKFFCSEWCAKALGFPQACRFSPAVLEIVIQNTKLKID